MEDMLSVFVFALLALIVYRVIRAFGNVRTQRRLKLIDDYRFPVSIGQKVAKQYPHLTDQDVEHVLQGLREYFHLSSLAGRKKVAMPSQAVDLAWHEFILFTRQYKAFCDKALGRFLHHTPAESMRSPTQAQQGIRTAWKLSCARESLDPRAPLQLPILFAIDSQLNIADGFHYSLDCKKSPQASGYCAGHIGCSSGGSGDSDAGSSCSGGCGGGGD